jgi:hypothetical protein
LHGLEEPAHALRGLEELFFQLCCCVSFWFWQETVGFGCTYYYVLGVPYSLVMCYFFWFWWEIVFAGNKKDTVVCLAGARLLLRPEKKVLVICLAGA